MWANGLSSLISTLLYLFHLCPWIVRTFRLFVHVKNVQRVQLEECVFYLVLSWCFDDTSKDRCKCLKKIFESKEKWWEMDALLNAVVSLPNNQTNDHMKIYKLKLYVVLNVCLSSSLLSKWTLNKLNGNINKHWDALLMMMFFFSKFQLLWLQSSKSLTHQLNVVSSFIVHRNWHVRRHVWV